MGTEREKEEKGEWIREQGEKDGLQNWNDKSFGTLFVLQENY